LKEWIQRSAENERYYNQLRNIWDASDKQTEKDEINTGYALERISARIMKASPKKIIWLYWQKFAAVLIIPLALGFLIWIYLNSQKIESADNGIYNEVYTTFGTRSSLQLSDSTIVFLNSGSSLRFPVKFNGKTRQVFLKGEAYFEVKSDVSSPFIVNTPSLKIKATGTKFNVQEYNTNPVIEVTLVSGKVSVSESGNTAKKQAISELSPKQHLVYNRETRIKTISNVDTYKYISWKDGKLIFRNDTLPLVLNKLSMIFNVDFELQGEVLRSYRYRATFQEESLEEILKLLKLSAPIDYTEVKRNPLPDGTFPKKKVIIYPVR
jgi:transmembrane sensor